MRSVRLTACLAALSVLATAAITRAAPEGVGFELLASKVTPERALFAGPRPVRLRFGFAAREPADLVVRIVARDGGGIVFSRRLDAVEPGRVLVEWNGLDRRDRVAADGRYAFRVGPAGRRDRFAGGVGLRGWVFPVDGSHGTRGAIGEFGAPRSGGRIHEGFDITADCGTRLAAIRGGEVREVGYDPDLYGHYLLINGRETKRDFFYSHLIAPPPFDDGAEVATGATVGRVGQTGNAASTPCHLHFEVRVDGRPRDPEPLLSEIGSPGHGRAGPAAPALRPGRRGASAGA